jgi:activator of HSP90 ATPase
MNPMETRTINHTINFNATPNEVYELIMDQDLHSEITGSEATMSKEIDGEFDVFDGYCQGYNIELVQGEKIVQAWSFAEDGWPEDHYSICTFLFEPTEDGTQLTFTQTDVPDTAYEALDSGWYQFYWDNITDYLDGNL